MFLLQRPAGGPNRFFIVFLTFSWAHGGRAQIATPRIAEMVGFCNCGRLVAPTVFSSFFYSFSYVFLCRREEGTNRHPKDCWDGWFLQRWPAGGPNRFFIVFLTFSWAHGERAQIATPRIAGMVGFCNGGRLMAPTIFYICVCLCCFRFS